MPKRCQHDGCDTRASFDVPGATRPRFCRAHSEAGMVDVISKHCQHDGCDTRASFDVPGATRPRFCRAHSEAGMVDVINKRCQHDGCVVRASHGFPGSPPSFCGPHHPHGTMLRPTRKCAQCREVATHGITQPERCEAHARPCDDNLVERECASCALPNLLNARNMCVPCEAFASGKRPRLSKQREVLQFLDYEFTEHPYDTTDVTPQGLRDCDRRERPDVMWDRPDRIVLLEIDEDQHRNRPCECEQTRMMNISQALGCERTVWIRYNPDGFTGVEARRWTSKAKRHAVLKRWLFWALTTEALPHTVTVVHLFFDDFQEGAVPVTGLL